MPNPDKHIRRIIKTGEIIFYMKSGSANYKMKVKGAGVNINFKIVRRIVQQ